MEKGTELLAIMLGKNINTNDETSISTPLKIINAAYEDKWNVKNNYPFTMIFNSSQSDRIYLARQTNNECHLISIDLTQVGHLYSTVQDTKSNNTRAIKLLLRGFNINR